MSKKFDCYEEHDMVGGVEDTADERFDKKNKAKVVNSGNSNVTVVVESEAIARALAKAKVKPETANMVAGEEEEKKCDCKKYHHSHY